MIATVREMRATVVTVRERCKRQPSGRDASDDCERETRVVSDGHERETQGMETKL